MESIPVFCPKKYLHLHEEQSPFASKVQSQLTQRNEIFLPKNSDILRNIITINKLLTRCETPFKEACLYYIILIFPNINPSIFLRRKPRLGEFH